MLISELKKYITEILLQEAQNPSTSKIPLGLINDIFYNVHDEVLPTIFDFLLNNNLNLDELFSQNSQYAIPLQKLIDQSQQNLIPFYDILIEDRNWNFLNQVLIKNGVLKPNSIKLDVGYYHNAGCLWDTNSRLPTIDSKNFSTLGFCDFSTYDKNQQMIEIFIALNLSHFLTPYFFDLYTNDRQKYFSETNRKTRDNNELRITIRHELEHYYQSVNQLLYQVQKEYQIRLKFNSFVNIANDCHNMIEHYMLSDEIVKGFGFANIKTNHLRTSKNPFKMRSDFYASRIDRIYLYNEAEIPNHLNDFCLLFVSYARYIFADADDALLWLRDFLSYLKGCDMRYVINQMWEYLDSGLWYTSQVTPHSNILGLFEDRRINVWDEQFRDHIGYFIENICRASKTLLFLHEIFSNANVIEQSLRKELVDVERYMQEFKKVKMYIIEKLINKVHKLWDDTNVNALEY